MTNEEINKLLKRRDICRTSINRMYKDPDQISKVIKLAEEYQELTTILIDNGRNLANNNPRFHPDTYKNGSPTLNINNIKPSPVGKIQDTVQEKPSNKYILSLAWTESPNHDVSSIISKVKEYFEDMDIEELECERSNKDTEVEYIVKYAFEGDERSFKILKYSAQFLLDTISDTDYAKFNIAIFGKKKTDDTIPVNNSLEDRVKKLEEQMSNILKRIQ